MREIGLSMVTDNGTIKPYEDFKKDVQKINATYNTNYLHAEYYHALGSAQMADKWLQIEKDGDRYDLQYRTAQDDHVREDHVLLDGITLPVSDPFWEKYFPPNGWGCRCTAVQVRKGKYPHTDSTLAMQRGDNATQMEKQKIFRFNPGKELKLFPPKHPYYKVQAPAQKVIQKVVKEVRQKTREEVIIEELPNNLNDEEKKAIAKNCVEIENALKKTKGSPMDIEQADMQSANPKHVEQFVRDKNGTYYDSRGVRYKKNPDYKESRDKKYSINCQTCAPAYILRLRGFDVTAKGKEPGSLSEYLSKQHSFEAWLNIDGSKCDGVLTHNWMTQKGYARMNAKRYKEYFEETCKEQGVYILTIGWKGNRRTGHATILQRCDDGNLYYIEPQAYDKDLGAKRSIQELCEKGSAIPTSKRGILRVDNKIFNLKFVSIFE